MSTANKPLTALSTQYKKLWGQLKLYKELALSCPAKHQPTLVKGIVNVKHRESSVLKAAGFPIAGKLIITRTKSSIHFELVKDLKNISISEL